METFDKCMLRWVCAPAGRYGVHHDKVIAALRCWWSDFTRCERCPDAKFQLRETQRLYEDDEYASCLQCLKNGQPFELHTPPMTLAKAREMLNAHRAAVKAVDDEHARGVAEAQRAQRLDSSNVVSSSMIYASKRTLRAERDVFYALVAAAFDWARNELIRVYKQVNEQFGKDAPYDEDDENAPPDVGIGPYGEQLQQFLAAVVNQQRLRTKQTSVPLLFCAEHGTLGAAFPIDGRLMYRDCFICEFNTPTSAPPPTLHPDGWKPLQ